MEILIIVALLLICVFFYQRKKERRIVNNFPSPPPRFFFGHILELRVPEERLNVILQYIKKYGTTLKFVIGPYNVAIATTDYKLIQDVLSKTKGIIKSENYQFLKPWLGTGLLITHGKEWRQTRKILAPTFHIDILKSYIEIFENVGNVLVDKMKLFCGRENVDLSSLISLCTLDIISETAMGIKIDAQNGRHSSYVQSIKEMCRILTDRGTSVLKMKDWSFVLTKDYYIQRKLLKILHGVTKQIIAEKKHYKNKFGNGMKKNKLSFLDLLLNYKTDNGQALSDEKIRQEVDTFMFAGHDTAACAINFTLFCLSNQPDIQANVLNEQKDLFGDNKHPNITHQDLQNMKYLENVIKESLRLYPPVPMIGRLATEDIEYENHVFGEGTNICLFIYGLHQNPEYFPEPETFNPNRFNVNGFASNAFMPFGSGHRNCIGQNFALLEIKSVVAKIVRNFELKPAVPKHELVLLPEIVLKSANGIKIRLNQRL